MMDLLSSMKCFVAVVEQNGFACAARKLYLSPPVLTKKINWLEDQLNTRLLERSTRRVSLTDTGTVFYQRCKAILSEVDAAKSAVMNLSDEPHGLIRISSPVSFGERHIVPLTIRFMDLYPNVQVNLCHRDCYVDMVGEQIDIVILAREILDPSLDRKHLCAINRGVVAAPSYLKKQGIPQTPLDLQQHNCLIDTHLTKNNVWELDANTTVAVSGNFKSDNANALKSAVLAGKGLLWTSVDFVMDELADGRLQLVFTDFVMPKIDIYAHYRKQHFSQSRVIKFLEFLEAELPKQVDPTSTKHSIETVKSVSERV